MAIKNHYSHERLFVTREELLPAFIFTYLLKSFFNRLDKDVRVSSDDLQSSARIRFPPQTCQEGLPAKVSGMTWVERACSTRYCESQYTLGLRELVLTLVLHLPTSIP